MITAVIIYIPGIPRLLVRDDWAVALLVVEVLAGVALHQLVTVPLGPVLAHAAGQVVETFQVAKVDVLTAGGGRVSGQGRRGGGGGGGRRRSGRGRGRRGVRLTWRRDFNF